MKKFGDDNKETQRKKFKKNSKKEIQKKRNSKDPNEGLFSNKMK
jgi:hypothetical protein